MKAKNQQKMSYALGPYFLTRKLHKLLNGDIKSIKSIFFNGNLWPINKKKQPITTQPISIGMWHQFVSLISKRAAKR
jgi:hypothetical protein